jgi:MarR family transcriptional regulator, organic hydroperoxide resistance regulator
LIARSTRSAPRLTAARDQDVAEVVNSLRRLFKAIHEYSKKIFKATGLSGPQVWALTILQSEPGLSHGELAERLFAHRSTVSGIVDRLEQRGVVTRTTDPEDRRGIRLTLTPLGKRVLRKSPPPVQLGLRRALERLPSPQLRRLRRMLQAVVQETAAAGIDAPFFDLDSREPPRRRPRRPD